LNFRKEVPVHADGRRKIATILKVLDEADHPLGSTKIARSLRLLGIHIDPRMVRNYLEEMDGEGLTVNLGRAGRQLTPRGRLELSSVLVIDKAGFLDARADELAFKMTLDLSKHSGTIIVNLSRIPAAYLDDARRIMGPVIRGRLGMGRFGLLSTKAAGVPGLAMASGEAVIGTVCSISLNGLLRAAGVPVIPRFGGLLEIDGNKPVRFTHIIEYAGTTLDPIEIFIRARMTSVMDAARTGTGIVGASFREVPAVSLPRVQKILRQMDRAGLGGMVLVGEPNRPLLEIPVDQGRAGIVIAAGLNPLAAVQEAGIPVENRAMARLCDFETLVPLV
jgi:HTH-type transcriptional regulator, global nitrogen regulator NrpRI